MKISYKRFYIGLFIPLALCAVFFGVSARLLQGAGEYLPVPAILDRITETYGYYGSAISQRTFHFKQEVYRRVRPDVAALGSSRVLQLRGESFNTSFANIGGMGSLDEVDEIARLLIPEHAPKLLLLGADFWWFNPANEGLRAPRSDAELRLKIADLVLPVGWLASGKMSLGQARAVLSGDMPHVGFSAIVRRDGFDRFGAYYYTSLWLGERENDDAGFATSRARIGNGASIFVHGKEVSEASLEKLALLLDYLKEHGVRVVLFIPPLAPAIVDIMKTHEGYEYLPIAHARLKEIARERGLPFADFHDLRAIGSNDCEFIDGIHGGQTAYARILLRLAIENEAVRKVVRLPETALDITRGKGRASLLEGETDFLKLGCEKAAL